MSTLAEQIALEEVRADLAERRSQQQKSKVRLLKIEQERATITTTMGTVDQVIAELQQKLRDLGGEE